MTVVYWAEENSAYCQNVFAELLEPDEISNKLLNEVMAGFQGNNVNFNGLNFENPFYVLGLSPNSAGLSVRFFLK